MTSLAKNVPPWALPGKAYAPPVTARELGPESRCGAGTIHARKGSAIAALSEFGGREPHADMRWPGGGQSPKGSPLQGSLEKHTESILIDINRKVSMDKIPCGL